MELQSTNPGTVARFAEAEEAHTVRGLRFAPSGAVDVIELEVKGREVDLDQVGAAIGCAYVERIIPVSGVEFWLDEEGLQNGGEPNLVATEAARGFWRSRGAPERWLNAYVNFVGPVVLLGDDATLSPDVAALLVRAGTPGVQREHVEQLGRKTT